MSRILTMALKDLKILTRDRFGMFWVLAFPLLMALFFGSVFSGGGSGQGSMKIGMVTDNKSAIASAFYEKLASSNAVTALYTNADSARKLVSEAKLVAYVYYQDTSSRLLSMFGGEDSPPIEVGIDPARSTESAYLKGLINQAYFSLLQSQMMAPQYWSSEVDNQLTMLDSSAGLTNKQTTFMRGFLTNLRDFMGTVDTTDSSGRASGQGKGPFSKVKIDLNEIAVARAGPRSSWEITFPQSLQWALIGVCAAFAIGMVTERTHGTYLRLRLAPVSRVQILAGKGLACFLAAVLVCFLLLSFGILVFHVRVASWTNLTLALVTSGFCFVGLMMMISVLGTTEQAVGGAGWALLLVLAMTGGGMIPLFAMPDWMSTVGSVSAVKWSVLAFEGAIWRGFSTGQMLRPVAILIAYGLVAFSVGVIILRRRDL
jgi:ABC-2 type transport system permease protein